eukprot:7735-Heterococcus_DN1.PRE.2
MLALARTLTAAQLLVAMSTMTVVDSATLRRRAHKMLQCASHEIKALQLQHNLTLCDALMSRLYRRPRCTARRA